MAVDSYKFLPRSMRAMYESGSVTDEPPVWAPLMKPVDKCTIALLTSAGVYLKDSQQGFDEEREWREPTWGDPTYRVIPRDVRQDQVACSHLHISHDDLLEDIDVVLPFRAFTKLEAEGEIEKLADEAYSFMGYQERSLNDWRTVQGPELAARLKERAVDVLLLAPA
jgi:D-proline reductase (dithiol) PrdB